MSSEILFKGFLSLTNIFSNVLGIMFHGDLDLMNFVIGYIFGGLSHLEDFVLPSFTFRGICPRRFCPWVLCLRGFCHGGFCPKP